MSAPTTVRPRVGNHKCPRHNRRRELCGSAKPSDAVACKWHMTEEELAAWQAPVTPAEVAEHSPACHGWDLPFPVALRGQAPEPVGPVGPVGRVGPVGPVPAPACAGLEPTAASDLDQLAALVRFQMIPAADGTLPRRLVGDRYRGTFASIGLPPGRFGCCAICGEVRIITSGRMGGPDRDVSISWCLVVDHDKETGLSRGLLCSRCNPLEGRTTASHHLSWYAVEAYRRVPPTAQLGLRLHYQNSRLPLLFATGRIAARE